MTDADLLERIHQAEEDCPHKLKGYCEECQLAMLRALAVDLLAQKDEIELAYLSLRMVVQQARQALDNGLPLSAHAILAQALKGAQPAHLGEEEECDA